MARTAVRRVNEWDGPSMLKVYTPYTGHPRGPGAGGPGLAGLCPAHRPLHLWPGLAPLRDRPPDGGLLPPQRGPRRPGGLVRPWSSSSTSSSGMCRRHIGTALWELMRDMLEMGNRRRVVCRVHRENQAALAFFRAMGFVPPGGGAPRGAGKAVACLSPAPLGPGRSEAPPSPTWWRRQTTRRPGKRPPRWWMFLGWNKGGPAALAAGFFAPVPSCQGKRNFEKL